MWYGGKLASTEKHLCISVVCVCVFRLYVLSVEATPTLVTLSFCLLNKKKYNKNKNRVIEIDRNRQEKSEQHSRWKQSERWWARKQWKDTLREGKERDGSRQEKGVSTDFPASNPGACGHHHSAGIHTQMHAQMHSDNPSALAKCCLIQPDLHSTEKANSLPLTVWKTERSSHKWQRSELPRFICVCECGCAPAGMHTCALSTAHVFIFVVIFLGVFCACVFTCIGGDNLFSSTPFIVWQADSLAALLSVFGGLSSNPACTASYAACVCVNECVGDSLHFVVLLHFHVSWLSYNQALAVGMSTQMSVCLICLSAAQWGTEEKIRPDKPLFNRLIVWLQRSTVLPSPLHCYMTCH